MFSLLNEEARAKIQFALYRYRFLLKYIVFGVMSLFVEVGLIQLFKQSELSDLWIKIFAVFVGMILAFYLNVRFNFRVPTQKRNRSLVFFIIISTFSFALSQTLSTKISVWGGTYFSSRLVSSGMLFLIAYAFHRKFSFSEFKKVGVAVYAHGNENINGIWSKIKNYADFIHIDIVDETFNKKAPDPTLYRLETVKAYWPKHEIHCHIMSKTPQKWLSQIMPYADTIIIHYEIKEDIDSVLSQIKNAGKKVGLCVLMDTPIEEIKPKLSLVDEIMLLSINTPGQSGSEFDIKTLDRISELNQQTERSSIKICVDGGVDNKIIPLLNVEKVISGSYVINADVPIENIMKLQTSSQYEAI